MSAEADLAYCARLTRDYGTTYYWGVRLLPPADRADVYAIYALCRLADDIVDAPGATIAGGETAEATRRRLQDFADRFLAALADPATVTAGDHPVVRTAVAAAVRRGIPTSSFERFFAAMAQDVNTTTYATYADLLGYMDGSAAVVGEMMLPVLRPRDAAAFAPAQDLGLAFQLTNFLRDVGEDLDRGRVYLPQEDLERFGADPWARAVTPAWRELMAFEIERVRALYRSADAGIAMLPPASLRCVVTARILYSQILDLIEAADYDVFSGRLALSTRRKAAQAARVLATPSERLRARCVASAAGDAAGDGDGPADAATGMAPGETTGQATGEATGQATGGAA